MIKLHLGREKKASFIKPMLAKETDAAFNDKDWIFEIKWDGYRAIAEIKKGEVELYSRNGLKFNNTYPPVYNELKKIKHDAVLDGEIVVLDEKGISNFQKLQHYEDNTAFPLCYYVFDLLSLNGKDTCELTLLERKKLLKQLIGNKSRIVKYSDHIVANGKDFFTASGKQGLEGIMAKKASSAYHKGVRTSDWLKIKNHQSDEAIIVGFTEPTGSRKYFGALVLAVRTKTGLKYAGHTGSGFSEKMLAEIYKKLKPLQTTVSPFKEKVKTNMPVTWVEPKFICELKFTEWTNDGKMRHPIFLRMRDDKTLKNMTMTNNTKAIKKRVTARNKKNSDDEKDKELLIGKTKVKTTNRNKLYWPKEGITKAMMIDYYQTMADYILPYLKDRPESLKRNPNGILDRGFYHKDAGDDAPSWVKSVPIYSDSTKKDIDYIICNNKQTLAYLNNLGCIELNPWNATTKALDKPDYMIIDLDPSAKNTYDQVVEAANVIKEVLDKAGAAAFCKTSGATGMHIYVPMGKKYLYEQVRSFAEIVCSIANEQLPFASMERNLKKRGNKMYLDYLQNSRGQTLAAAYSLRPYPGATVSTPLQWKEVKPGLHPSAFHIFSVPARIKKMKDIFSGVLGKGVDLKRSLSKLS
ncbi:MAG: DNA ligase D [Ferruginibacter sp.]